MAFNEIKKKLGFGCMRLPMKGLKVDTEQFSQMVDTYIEAGFNYFDTAHGYIRGLSEKAVKTCLTSRYPRESYILTNKLTSPYFTFRFQIKPLINRQLKACGVEYFDFLLMHAQNAKNYAKYKRLNAYETAYSLKEEGKIKHFGISFHDKAEVLDMILTEHPEIEVVQLQFNYLDYDDPVIQSRKCFEVCQKHNKPVFVMEPVKGGALANLPPEAKKIVNDLNSGSAASLAIRYAAGFDNVASVLSGMSNMEQLKDNISYMKDFKPLSDKEKAAIQDIKSVFASKNLIRCTTCRYCQEGCPKQIPIPDIFSCVNQKRMFNDWNSDYYFKEIASKDGHGPEDCIGCGACEKICPQSLPIRELLKTAPEEFKKPSKD